MELFTGSPSEWSEAISSLPSPHLLQTAEWAGLKNKYGWQSFPYVWKKYQLQTGAGQEIVAGAMILQRTVSFRGFESPLNIFYCPKGPLMDWTDEELRTRVLKDIEKFSRSRRGIFIKIDPDVKLGVGIPGMDDSHESELGSFVKNELYLRGWRFSSSQVQFRNTVLVDLTGFEEDLLTRMKQKTRYNIRLASKKGVDIRIGSIIDIPMLYRMYAETSVRDGFVIRDQGYYEYAWSFFMSSNQASTSPAAIPLIAEVEGDPVAAIFLFYFAGRGYYLYGMSRDVHRDKMPNHLLQWEAMKLAKSKGCQSYDMWGAPDDFIESDPLWGVYKFKDGFGGQVIRTLGGWDFAPSPFWYKIYTVVMPRVLDVMRNRGKRNIQSHLDT